MRVETVAPGIKSPPATIALLGEGTFAEAVGALLSARSHRVLLLGARQVVQKHCDLILENRARYASTCSMPGAELSYAGSSDAVVVAVPATAFGATFRRLAPHLNSGQTIFIAGAAFGAALQAEIILGNERSDLSVSVVEVSRPFVSVEDDCGSLRIEGVKDMVLMAGRSLNATRNGLRVGGGICNGIVPASNIIERGFSDAGRWLDTAALLFSLFNSRPGGAAANIINSLKIELQTLARAYGINRLPELPVNPAVSPGHGAVEVLSERICEDFIILSELARLKHSACPILDSVIELAGALAGDDLRRQGRQLADLGLIGMDACEIIEHVSA